MHRIEYERMAALEGTMWWYRALHDRIIAAVEAGGLLDGDPLLDAGCGTGGLLARLSAARPGLVLLGLEYDAEAADMARAKTSAPISVGSVHAIPHPDGHLAAIISADVLCHAAVEPTAALAEFHRCLRPGGLLFLNLPAYAWMASAHDEHVQNVRRYSRSQAIELVTAAGFDTVKAGFWNSLLFPLMLAHRIGTGRSSAESDVHAFPDWQNQLFLATTAFERRIGLRLPFGGSIWVSARKP
jgi:SAM-dependent methyltransferase